MFSRDLSKFAGVLFRLDGNEGVVGLSTHLTNLSRLMENSPHRYEREGSTCQSRARTSREPSADDAAIALTLKNETLVPEIVTSPPL